MFASRDKDESAYSGDRVHIKGTWVAMEVARRLTRMAFVALALCLAFYFLTVATTVARYVWTGSYGLTVTRTPRTPNGRIEHGSQLYVQLDQDHGYLDGTLSKLKLAVLPQSHVSKVSVVYGPAGRLNITDSGYIIADGMPTGVKAAGGMFTDDDADGAPDPIWLKGQYLAVCVSGYCAKQGDAGVPYVLDGKGILGEAIGRDYEPIRAMDPGKAADVRRQELEWRSRPEAIARRARINAYADAIIRGQYHDPAERREKLGDDYDAVMKEVADRCGGEDAASAGCPAAAH